MRYFRINWGYKVIDLNLNLIKLVKNLFSIQLKNIE